MKKGFTVIELIVSISLIAVITLLLFSVIRSGNNIYQNEIYNTELLIKQSQISYALNNNFKTLKPIKITSCGNLCIDILYENNETDTLKIDRINNTIYLDKEKYILPRNARIDYVYSDIATFQTKNELDSILNIYVGILDEKNDENYDINIIYMFNNATYSELNTIDFSS